MQRTIALWISRIGHPIVFGTGLALFINYSFFSNDVSKSLSLRLLIGIVIPLAIYIAFKINQGVFKDADVSDIGKRNSLYRFLLGLILIQLVFYFIVKTHYLVFNGFLLMGIYIAICYGFNSNNIKVSLHTSFSFLSAILTYQLAPEMSAGLFLFALLVAYSRVILGRHSFREVVIGMAVGVCLGLFYNTILLNDFIS